MNCYPRSANLASGRIKPFRIKKADSCAYVFDNLG
jgi:hypothetical protein